MIYSAQIRAARGLLDWSRDELVDASGLSRSTLQRMERGDGIATGHASNLWQVQQVLEAAGIIFLPADQSGGPGVRVRTTS
ncbi:helix-turn-helix transcriptional regulator [Parvibaculum sp.]|uniref:helix-turn-helix domain-containing protein n=1 Tax=Parvibaculum sp. TaxID=2024848 RepID=UPI00329A3307